MVTSVAVMQPTFLPWLGYLDLIDRVEVFVLLDDVQFVRRSWQHRNRVIGDGEPRWLTVPVRSQGRDATTIERAEIADAQVIRRHEGILRSCYPDAFSTPRGPWLVDLMARGIGRGRLGECNAGILADLNAGIGMSTPLVRASTIGRRRHDRVGHLIELVQAVGGRRYVAVEGSADYLITQRHRFDEVGIELAFHTYEHPVYDQGRPFVSHLSIADALLRVPHGVAELIRSGRRPLRGIDELEGAHS